MHPKDMHFWTGCFDAHQPKIAENAPKAEYILKPIAPSLFAQVMSLPPKARIELLELLGTTPLNDAQLRDLLAETTAQTGTQANRCQPATA